jgi:hypothetical protein
LEGFVVVHAIFLVAAKPKSYELKTPAFAACPLRQCRNQFAFAFAVQAPDVCEEFLGLGEVLVRRVVVLFSGPSFFTLSSGPRGA